MPLFLLRRLDEAGGRFEVEPAVPVEFVTKSILISSALDQPSYDLLLKSLLVESHLDTSEMVTSPMTAAVICACRRSRSSMSFFFKTSSVCDWSELSIAARSTILCCWSIVKSGMRNEEIFVELVLAIPVV